MTKEEWKETLEEEEVIFTPRELNKNQEEALINKLAEIFSTEGLKINYVGDPIGSFQITKGEFEGENNRLYLIASSERKAEKNAEILKKAGYKADSAWELDNPWTRVFNII